uniref:CUB domain-containing protein n=1 Tax=Branchiostoma floridae TaxID=7739 RepID=C3Y920_BRAFL|eukprot:XP_002607066.1 hypothetical protein BRAFLDRAFT_68143 [Branchiostoma floridae]
MGYYCSPGGNRVDISDSDAGDLYWGSYPALEDCAVSLVAAVGKRIFLQFTDISIRGTNSDCEDELFVKSGSYTATGTTVPTDGSWEKVCGTFHQDFDAHDHHVTLKLKSYQNGGGRIRIRYTVYHSAHYDGCDGYTCLGRDMCIDDSLMCLYLLQIMMAVMATRAWVGTDYHGCDGYTCLRRDRCIDDSLMCDGVDHCGDNSDEEFWSDGGCGVVEHRQWLKKVAIITGCVGGVLLLIVVTYICYRRKKRQGSLKKSLIQDFNSR